SLRELRRRARAFHFPYDCRTAAKVLLRSARTTICTFRLPPRLDATVCAVKHSDQRLMALRCRARDGRSQTFFRDRDLRNVGKRNTILHCRNFGQDRNGDLRRRPTSNVKAYRPVQPSDLLAREIEFFQPFATLGVVRA